MIQLLTGISNLPTLDLNEFEASELGLALQSLPTVTGDGIAQCLKIKASLSDKKQAQVVAYVTATRPLGLQLITFSTHLIRQLGIVLKRNIGADELFPLLVELMPRNVNKLKLLRVQLELLCDYTQLVARNQEADEYKQQLYYYTQLLGAVTQKLSTLNAKRRSGGQPEAGEELPSRLAIELRKADRLERRLHDLQTICAHYQSELMNEFMRDLIAEENPLYRRYFKGHFSHEPVEERLSALFIAVEQRKEIFSDERLDAMSRILAIDQLCTILNKDNYSTHEKAVAFKYKFDQHIDLFENHTQRPRNFFQRILNFLFCFNLCPAHSKLNQSFLNKGGLFGGLRERNQAPELLHTSLKPWLHKHR